MGGLLLRLKTWWQGADRTQKLITVFGGGSLVVLLFATFIFASRPKMELVFNNLSPEDTGSVAMEIENMGIAVNFDNNGNVFVPSEKRAQVRASLAMKGKLPKAGSQMGEALKAVSPFGDPRVQAEQLKAIAENELAQSIQFFEGVDSASVQVTPAVDSVFEGDKKPAQANITVAEKVGSSISEDQARAMASLVASAVPGLDKSKVTIFTRTGRALWDGQDMETGTAKTSTRLEMQKLESRAKRDQLQEALNRMLGPGNAIAMVDLTLNVDDSEKSVRKIDPTKPIEARKINEVATSGSGAAPLPRPGMEGNTTPPELNTGGGSSTNAYEVGQSHTVLGTNTTEEHTKHTGGDVQSMAITVLVNKTEKINVNPADPNDPVVALAASYLGPRAADPANFTSKVVAYPFDTSQAKAAQEAAAATATSSRMQQLLSILPIAALLIVAFMVVKSIGKLANKPLPPMLAAAVGGGPALPMPHDHTQSLLSTVAGHAQPKALDAANRFVLPEIVKQKALEAGISEEQLQAAIEEAGDAGISVDDIPSIKSKINVPLEQIKKMANERPEAVAMLIKSWLIEEGIRR